MANKAIESLDEASRKVTATIERITNEGLTVAQERVDALVNAYDKQCKVGLDLLKKSSETLKGITEGELPDKAKKLVDQAVETARHSADTWIEFAQTSLGGVRRVIAAAVENEKAA